MSYLPGIYHSGAELSPDGRYRYELIREWRPELPLLGWVMLNPSTADDHTDDATIRRCIRFATDRGYGGIVVRNLFALRATNPDELIRAADPIGPENIHHLTSCSSDAMTVAAWGAHKAVQLAWPSLRAISFAESLVCLGTTKSGAPRHPLYVRSETPFQSYQVST